MKSLSFRSACMMRLVATRQARKLFVLAVVAMLLCWPLPRQIHAAAGDLDLTFGGDGKVTTDFFSRDDAVNDIAIQGNGKIVAVGSVTSADTFADFGLARYNADGSLDTSFDGDGRVNTDFVGLNNLARAVVIQSDGKIIAAGQTSDVMITNFDFALARYNADGSLDASFDGDGKVITHVGIFGEAFALALQTDGKVIAAGTTNMSGTQGDFALVRYNTDGSVDTSFGAGGVVLTDFSGSDIVLDLAIQSDGKIVAAGVALNSNRVGDFALARYNTNGSLDTSFGSGGKVITDFFGGSVDLAQAVKIQSDGKIVAAGSADTLNPITRFFALARYNTNGSLDSSFDGDGRVTAPGGEATDMAIQSDGKIVIVGIEDAALPDFVLARFNTDGTPDTSFGSGGIVFTDFFNGTDIADAVALQPDQKIVAAGAARTSEVAGAFDFALARYLNDVPAPGPEFDICIQAEGGSEIFRFNSTTGEYQFTDCAGLTITGTGAVSQRGSLISLDHSAPDRRVQVRVSGIRATVSIQLFSPRRTFTFADTNITNNTCGCQ